LQALGALELAQFALLDAVQAAIPGLLLQPIQPLLTVLGVLLCRGREPQRALIALQLAQFAPLRGTEAAVRRLLPQLLQARLRGLLSLLKDVGCAGLRRWLGLWLSCILLTLLDSLLLLRGALVTSLHSGHGGRRRCGALDRERRTLGWSRKARP
jgi:hypothetical protein